MARALGVLVAAAVLAGCGGDPVPAGIRVEDHVVDSRGVGRELPGKVVVPGDGPRPLLVFLHGRGAPVWLDAGDEDAFRPGQEAFVAALGDVGSHTWPGGHDGDYWDRHRPDYLRWYARELERC